MVNCLSEQQRLEARRHLTQQHRVNNGDLILHSNGMFEICNVSERDHALLMQSLRDDDRIQHLTEIGRYDFGHVNPITRMAPKKFTIRGAIAPDKQEEK